MAVALTAFPLAATPVASASGTATGGDDGRHGDAVPYLFERFTFDARATGLEDDPPSTVVEPARPPRERTGQYPFTRDIVGFAARGGRDREQEEDR